MKGTDDGSRSSTTEPIGALVDEACDVFEASWQRGEQPRIEDFLDRVGPRQRATLMVELLAIDVSYRLKNREKPCQREYIERFPDEGEAISRVFCRYEPAATHHDATPPFPSQTREISESISISSRFSQLAFHDEGGLGEVFSAHDEELGRDVAIKFIRARHAANDDMVSRFYIEAEVTGRLDHPGVVPVYGIGESWDGRPCYAMRFIDGVNLRSAIHEFRTNDWKSLGRGAWRMEMHRLLEHLVAACDTVAYAHNRGILHRDIKPENIMLGRFGETLIVDWGLAQCIQRDEQAKASGEKTLLPGMFEEDRYSRGGTVGYVAPEQVPGSSDKITKACDIYSLGATLYELLTGETAFCSCEGREVWNRIRRGEFPRPRDIERDCPVVLEAICLKAMALRAQDRYATVSEFAQDLRRWMADEPVDARREPLWERIARVARRHRAWSFAVASVVLLVLLTTVGGMFFFGRQARREYELRTIAETAERVAEDARLANLRSVATFAASKYGYEIDQRWRILGEVAAMKEFQVLVQDASGKPVRSAEQLQLQEWLTVQSSELVNADKASSWFVNDATGIQLARNPWDDTIGRSYRHRTYFHGGERDTLAEEAQSLTPITRPNLSAVYVSTATHELKVSFTVPIWGSDTGDDLPPIGVLGMSVRLGAFVQLEGDLESMSIVLVDLRTDWLEGEPKRGLVLDHPNLDAARLARLAELRLMPEQVEPLDRLRSAMLQRRRWKGGLGAVRPPVDRLSQHFKDPVAEDGARPCIAAFEPVFVPGREEALADTGWVVIIEDLADSKEDIGTAVARRSRSQ
jgi:serine/threonine-protein kinase